MKPIIVRQNGIEEFYTDEKCYIKELLNGDEDPEMSFALARVEPGVTTVLHSLRGTSERYIVIAGMGKMEVGGLSPVVVSTGDLILIPPDTPQRITNIGTGDLIFCCICAPRFEPSIYVDLEKLGSSDAD